jgi:uncharacterized protein YndB with AHSA1/START domain
MSIAAAKPNIEPFVISRTFDAPRELVFKAFTDVDRLKHWWGPKGFKVMTSPIDLRPGGIYHYSLQAPDGTAMWGRFAYREIAAPERIVYVSSFSDEKGGLTRHFMHEKWPLELLSTLLFRRRGLRPHQGYPELGSDQRKRCGARDLRRQPRKHDTGLDRHVRESRSLSRRSQIART